MNYPPPGPTWVDRFLIALSMGLSLFALVRSFS